MLPFSPTVATSPMLVASPVHELGSPDLRKIVSDQTRDKEGLLLNIK